MGSDAGRSRGRSDDGGRQGSAIARSKDPSQSVPPKADLAAVVQRATSDVTSLGADDLLKLQFTIGNRALQRVLSVQRVVIQQNALDGLTANLDTTNLEVAKALIDTLEASGKRQSLVDLYTKISKADQTERTGNNKLLMEYTEAKLKRTTASVPENAKAGVSEKLAIKYKYWSQTATNNVVQAGLRMWVTGDPARGIGWNMIGKHLRGRLQPLDYQLIGTLTYLLEDQRNVTTLEAGYTVPQRIQKGTQLLDDIRDDIRGALDALPDHDGVSYRQAGVANASVYGGLINVGDYIRDTTFWSTSALRISGSAGEWGDDGTLAHPKVYFIIDGSSGKYIAKYSGQEEGQHEVLFKDRTTFQVTNIANFRNETFFVHVTEVNPATVHVATKNPFNGT